MPSVTRLAWDVAAKIWPVVRTQAQPGWWWLRRMPLWSASGLVAVILLILLIADWKPYSKHYRAFTPLFTLAAGLAVAGVTLMRHFAQTDADRQRRITESFSKAIEQLGSDKLEVRLGGIYALERISQESPQDHWTVMENLSAFVRERTQRTGAERTVKPRAERAYLLWEKAGRPEGRSEEFWREAVKQDAWGELPDADITAVLTVIKRRSEKHRAQDEKILDLRQAVLRRAGLLEAHLEGATLADAHLEGAILFKAHLQGANLAGAYLEGAVLTRAHLEGAILLEAHLEETNLAGAYLKGAILQRALLDGANLRSADLGGADGLTQEQIDRANGDTETTIPEGLTRPAHWIQPEGGAAPAA